MRIAVTGAGGFLGSRVIRFYQDKHDIIGYFHKDLDFTDPEKTRESIERDRPDILIHTAAISDVGACEKDPVLSEQVNVEGARNLAVACRQTGTRMLFCSSDQVYVGNGEQDPHREEERLCPPTVYGRQKIRAEEIVFSILPDTVALRLSWMFAVDYREGIEHGNLISAVCQAAKAGSKLSYPVHDRRSITDVWEVVRNLEVMFHVPAGIYNFGSENNDSTYDVVREMIRAAGMDSSILEKNEKAFRDCPRNLRMNIDKVKACGVSFLTAGEALKKAGKSIEWH